MRHKILFALSLACATPVMAAPADDLRALMADHYQWLLRENPIEATTLGVRDHDDRSAAHRLVECVGPARRRLKRKLPALSA